MVFLPQMRWLSPKFKTVLACLLAFAAHYGANSRFGLTPAIGPLLSPFEGFWQNADAVEQPNVPVNIPIKAIRQAVVIRWDSSLVPHIEAQNQADLFFAQGYVCASLRLWQMDFITRAASGRLSEVLGNRALEYDKFQRRFGMCIAAEASRAQMVKNPTTRLAVERYTQGVNAYIAGLELRQLPLEYKILGYQPEPWTPLKTAYLLKYLSFSLTGHTEEVALAKAKEQLGAVVFNVLYPSGQAWGPPVMPAGTSFSFKALIAPATDTIPALFGADLGHQANRANGSNNWVVSGSKTATGKPLLANDPHLGLQLPSFWIRMQLSAPGYHASGVTLPGAPGLIIGHNKAIAWGTTNTDADVLDLYKVSFAGPDHYWYQGKKKAFTKKIETIKLTESNVVLDTLLITELGPVVYHTRSNRADIPAGMVASWVAHKPSNDLACFLGLAKASNMKAARQALSHLSCPAQNFAYADTAGNIGMFIAGALPLRQKDEGKWARNLDKATVYRFIPWAQNPYVVNPSQGFVQSANQASTGAGYPYYINWRQSEGYRGQRIAERLQTMQGATIDSMAALQMDVKSLVAQRFLPLMLAGVGKGSTSGAQQDVLEALRSWNLRYDSDQIAPAVFDAWFIALQDTVWDELKAKGYPYPPHTQLQQVLTGGILANLFIDVQATKELETTSTVCKASLQKVYNQLMEKHGAAGKAWHWGRVKHTGITHMAMIPGLSESFLSVSGSKYNVNATSQNHGPSLRTVVSLTKPIQAYGNMPGGQSGNPGSTYYTTELQAWEKGTLLPWQEYEPSTKKVPKLMRIWRLTR